MKKKDVIVVIGCSFSRNSVGHKYKFKINHTYSWPELLAMDLGKSYHVLNYSAHGNSNSFILFSAQKLAETFKDRAAMFVLQFTRGKRQTFVYKTLDKIHNIESLTFSEHTNVEELANYKEWPSFQHQETWKFNEVGLCFAYPGKPLEFSNRLQKIYNQNLLHSCEFHMDNLFQEAIMRQAVNVVKREGIPVVAYLHPYFRPSAKNSFDFLDFIVERDFVGAHSYQVDSGFHLNAEGQRLLLNNFIRPCIDTKI